MFALTPEEQRWNLEEFRRKSKILLTNQERDYLHDILKQYQTYRDVQRLMMCLMSALDTPRKLDLLREIRNLIPLSHLPVFDRLAPYSKMMHPYYPVGIISESKPPAGRRRQDVDRRLIHNRHEEYIRSSEEPGKTRTITIMKDDSDLGFGIKACPGRTPGVIVSHVEPGSQAELNGLKSGVQILEVNNIDFERITVASALLVLQGTDRIRMKILYARPTNNNNQRENAHHAPVVKDTTTTWIDTANRKKVAMDFNEHVSRMDGTRPLTSGDERRVILKLSEDHRFIGFNIRGGSEYGLGIYVSRVDKGGLAEANGIRVGDQIVNVNGENFEQITHGQAVQIIKNLRHLIMTIRSVNRYPAYKELSGEEGVKEQKEMRPKEKSSSRPSSIHLPVGAEVQPPRVKHSRPLMESKPKQPTAEIKPMSLNIVQSKPPSQPLVQSKSPELSHPQIKPMLFNKVESKPPSQPVVQSHQVKPMTVNRVESKPPSQPMVQSKSPIIPLGPPNGMVRKIMEKSELSIQTESTENMGEDSVDFGGGNDIDLRGPLSPIPEMSPRPASQTSIAIQTIQESGEDNSPPPLIITPPAPQIDKSPKIQNKTVLNPRRKLGRSVSMKLPGEKPMPMLDEQKPKKTKVQRNRTFREILFGIKVKHKDKESAIGKEKTKEKKEKKHRKKISIDHEQPRRHKKHSGVLSALKARSKDAIEDDQLSNAGSSHSGDSSYRGSIGEASSIASSSNQGSISKHATVSKQRSISLQEPTRTPQIIHPHLANTPSNVSGMARLTERAQELLNDDEVKAIIRHVKRYHREGGIEGLVEPLLAILDKPQKVLLLRDIRGVISATDVGRFDSMVSRREIEAHGQLQTGSHDDNAVMFPQSPQEKQLTGDRSPSPTPREFLGSQKRKIHLDPKPDQQGNFHLQDLSAKDEDHLNEELDHLQAEIDNIIIEESKLKGENEETVKSNNVEYGHIARALRSSPERENPAHTVSGRPKERRGLDNLALPKAAIVRRHSDNATGREAMKRNLSGLTSTVENVKISAAVKPTSPPPPPPPRTPTKPVIPPPSPVRSPSPAKSPTPVKSPPQTLNLHRLVPKNVSPVSSPVQATRPVKSKSPSTPSALSYAALLQASTSLVATSTTKSPPPVSSRPTSSVVATSPTKSPLPPPVSSRPTSPPAVHFNTSTPLSLPPPPPNSTFSPTISPEAIDDLPPPPPPEPIPPPALDTSPLPPPPPLESLSPVPPAPPMDTHPLNISKSPIMRDSPPPPPPVAPPPPPPLLPESFLMAQKANSNFDTTCDENPSDSHIYSEIQFNNMDVTANNNTKVKQTNVQSEPPRKSLTFNVPSSKETVPNIHIMEDNHDDDNHGDDSGDDVALPEFSEDSDTSDTDSESSGDNNDNKRTFSYNFIPEEDEDEYMTDSSFDPTPSPDPADPTDRSFSAPPALNISNASSSDANSDAHEPVYAEVDKTKKTRKAARQDTLTVEFDEKIMTKEEEEEEDGEKKRRPSRVSFGEYRSSPTPPKRGILKNSFNMHEGGQKPKVQIRSAIPDYISISSDEEEEPSPLKEIMEYAKKRAQEDLLRPADDTTPANSPKVGRKAISLELSKFRSSLGISIAGGRESQGHPMVRIDKIFPGGAAADNGSLKPGYEVLEVDGTPLTSSTHPEAVDIIRRAYNDKSKAKIEFVVVPYD